MPGVIRHLYRGTAAWALLLVPLIAGIASGAVPDSSATHLSSVSLAYWNDTADLERYLVDGNGFAQDDYVTASVAVRASFVVHSQLWTASWSMNLITVKDDGYRTDLMSLMLAAPEVERGAMRFGVAAGIAGNGRFGGDFMQNNYHSVGGIQIIHLEYPAESKIGPQAALMARIEPMVRRTERFSLIASTLNTWPAGYHRARLEGQFDKRLGEPVEITVSFGYTQFYGLTGNLQTAFQSGVNYGLAARVIPTEFFTCSIWVHSDLYRHDQAVPGISITFGLSGSEEGNYPGTLSF